jgi:hypothetical protein
VPAFKKRFVAVTVLKPGTLTRMVYEPTINSGAE